MCIATFIESQNKLIYTFTRDERIDRPFKSPEIIEGTIIAPIDLEAGGTWIGCNGHHIYSLQNGGKIKHSRELPYDKSRGVILMELLKSDDLEAFFKETKGSKIEPFTLCAIDIDNSNGQLIYFNGTDFETHTLSQNHTCINFSSTLYNENLKSEIKEVFKSVDTNSPEDILKFHFENRIGSGANRLERPSSSSITQFIINDESIECRFLDLIELKNSTINLSRA